jgi:hypothetical protein
MNQEYCKSVSAWLSQNPIRLNVLAGQIAKSELAYAVNITPQGLRYRITVLCNVNPEFKKVYQERARRTQLPIEVAEMIVRLMFDNNPNIRIEFFPMRSN